MVRLIFLTVVIALTACVSQHEVELSQNKEWEQLGAYHGTQGYREWDENRLSKQGAMTETEYEKYRAGYLQGRFEYCSQKKTVNTVVNQGYPDECGNNPNSYGLIDRGY
ncbi:DUF2799 domain-containing protein [Photobacterium chitinilyticum]|uniref:DUF2799 domain-containing protein n=1 Tax=Photobacterium chitinilyticum TaxID=2485123 RepID=A0A444JJQ4_9GAMM|nr:DUF2799 domain-containing protein [Photobacterium chitinilyticum]RWX53323.1 DUF2799 domain-containing protein [Photobacterium chitinilyticum]